MTTAAVSIARRVHIVDIVRGIAVVLMAIDHVRVYSGVPPGDLILASSSRAG